MLIRYIACKYFLPFHELPFHFLDSALWLTEVFNFDEIQFISVTVLAYAFSQKIIAKFKAELKL